MNESEKILFLKSVLSDLQQEVISRREPEFLYTSSYIASTGAVAWGIAALSSISSKYLTLQAIVAVTMILSVGYFVYRKIGREYKMYKGEREEQGRITKILLDDYKIDPNWFPKGLIQSQALRGHKVSQYIVIAAGLLSSIFCIAVSFK